MRDRPNVRYAGQVYEQTIDGDRFVQRWRVPGYLNEVEAIEAPGIPKIHEKLKVGGIDLPLYCHRKTCESASEGVETTKTVVVEYGAPRPIVTFNGLIEKVRWSVGMINERADASANGKAIGDPRFAEANGTYAADLGVLDKDAELGAEQLRPTLDITVECGVGVPFDPALVMSLAGRTNSAPFTIAGYSFPVGYLLFLGGEGESWAPNSSLATYRFTIGFKILPSTAVLPRFVEHSNDAFTTALTNNMLPIRYGTWIRWAATIRQDPNNGENVPFDRRPCGVSIYEAYPVASFNALRFR